MMLLQILVMSDYKVVGVYTEGFRLQAEKHMREVDGNIEIVVTEFEIKIGMSDREIYSMLNR